jgi:hypothetical protein
MALKTAVHLIYNSTENNIELLFPNHFVSYKLMHLFLHYQMQYGQITFYQISKKLLLIHECNICNCGSYFLTQILLQTGVCIFTEFKHKRLIGHLLDIQTVFLHGIIFIHP